MTDKLQFSVRLTPEAHALVKEKSKHAVGAWLSDLIVIGCRPGVLEQMRTDIEELKQQLAAIQEKFRR